MNQKKIKKINKKKVKLTLFKEKTIGVSIILVYKFDYTYEVLMPALI